MITMHTRSITISSIQNTAAALESLLRILRDEGEKGRLRLLKAA